MYTIPQVTLARPRDLSLPGRVRTYPPPSPPTSSSGACDCCCRCRSTTLELSVPPAAGVGARRLALSWRSPRRSTEHPSPLYRRLPSLSGPLSYHRCRAVAVAAIAAASAPWCRRCCRPRCVCRGYRGCRAAVRPLSPCGCTLHLLCSVLTVPAPPFVFNTVVFICLR
jgi:hypothetical protein